jgi:hypothetical protein
MSGTVEAVVITAGQAGATATGHQRARFRRRLAVPLLASAFALVVLAVPPALAAPQGTVRVGPVIQVSNASACPGGSAEVEQATAPPRYVYEAWIGCGGEGFARSTDGGAHFSKAITLPDSSGSDDPAVAVSPGGVVYVSYLRYTKNHAYPVVATSFNHGATFSQVSSLIPARVGNWGDRDFIAAGRGGTVYVTWDYGPSMADVKIVCSPVGSCAYSAVDATAFIQKSTDYGKTWGPLIPMQPGFPAGGGYDASLVVQPSGVIDALIWNHQLNPATFAVHPGYESFTSSRDGGKTWSPARKVGGRAGTIALPTWWIDGNLGTDQAGNLYATWDTQTSSTDVGWLSYSTTGGRTWSAPRRVTPDSYKLIHNVEVVGISPGRVAVAWQVDTPLGYATYLRPFSIGGGWLAPVTRVSNHYGASTEWPGDTFGLSVLPGSGRIALSWGTSVGTTKDPEIYAAVADLSR